MKNNILKLILIFVGIILIYFLKTYFEEYNLEKATSACILGKKRTSESFDYKKAKKFCEEEIRKRKNE